MVQPPHRQNAATLSITGMYPYLQENPDDPKTPSRFNRIMVRALMQLLNQERWLANLGARCPGECLELHEAQRAARVEDAACFNTLRLGVYRSVLTAVRTEYARYTRLAASPPNWLDELTEAVLGKYGYLDPFRYHEKTSPNASLQEPVGGGDPSSHCRMVSRQYLHGWHAATKWPTNYPPQPVRPGCIPGWAALPPESWLPFVLQHYEGYTVVFEELLALLQSNPTCSGYRDEFWLGIFEEILGVLNQPEVRNNLEAVSNQIQLERQKLQQSAPQPQSQQ
eukprot:gene11391-2075_t